MRPIKYRAWNKELKQMRQILVLEMEPKEFPQTSTRVAIYTVFDHPCVHSALIKARFAKWRETECVVMQFTGLLDKNGKEIYEGDMVNVVEFKPGKEINDDYYKVIYKNGSFKLSNPKNNHEGFPYLGWEHSVVVGNIYEHPHLLTQETEKE